MNKVIFLVLFIVNVSLPLHASSDLYNVSQTELEVKFVQEFDFNTLRLSGGPTCSSEGAYCSCAAGQTCSAGGGSCSCENPNNGGGSGGWEEAFIEWLIEIIFK